MSRFKVGDRVIAKHKLETCRLDNGFEITEINAMPGDMGLIIAIDPAGEGNLQYYHVEFFDDSTGFRRYFSTDVHEDSLDPCPQS